MEQFGPGGNFPVKVVHLQRWSSLTSRSSLTRNYCSIFRNIRFQSCSSLSLHTVVKMADGSDVGVYECGVCNLQTQDQTFSLCTVAHKAQVQQSILICFFFGFSSVFKDKHITGFSNCRRCFPTFFSCFSYPTINSVGVLVPTRSILPWLVQVVSDWSVQYNGKHLK